MSHMENHLWNLANVITGFAVVQSLAFLYALGTTEFMEAVRSPLALWTIAVATVVASAVYCCAIYWVSLKGALLADDERTKEIWTSVTWGRLGAICLFNSVVLVVMFLLYRVGPSTMSSDPTPVC